MSNKKTSSARFRLKIDSFDGIDSGAKHKNPLGSSQIVNFRIDKNGSLIKRCGSKRLLELEDDIDGVWYGMLFGKNRLILVSNSNVYEYVDSCLNLLGQIDGLSRGEFSMFFFNDCLYFINRNGMYRLDERGFSTPRCYAPLIGKNWPSGWMGEIHEKKNLLSDYVRISYVAQENAARYLRVTERVEQVVSIYKNGKPLSSSEYTVDNDNMLIILNTIIAGDVFEVTLKYFQATDALSIDARSAARCYLFGGIETKRPYLWGTASEDAVYACKHLSTDQRNAANKYITCDPFYVTEDDVIKVGGGNRKVTALTRHLGRTLIFTESDAWRSTEKGESALGSDSPEVSISNMELISINTGIGVRNVNGVTLADNDPISIGDRSLFRWTSNTDVLDEQNAYPISSDIDPLISDSFRKSSMLYFDKKRKEIYFYSSSANSSVWVWQMSSGKWVRFEGFTPTYMFEYEGETAFVSGNVICAFYDYLMRDDNTDIEAYFKSNPIDFGSFEDKHVHTLGINATGSFTLNLFYDGSATPDTSFNLTDLEHGVSKRVSGKRFKYAELAIMAGGDSRQSVYSVELTAR